MMPDVAPRTRAAYDRLPEAYRDADAGLDYPLLRYLSLLLDQLAPLDDLTERIDYDAEGAGTSDLVDATTANAAWFPWIAQLLGVDLTGLTTIAEQRLQLADPTSAWAHGTPGAIAAAAARGLTGTRAVTVDTHHDGNPWAIGIGTLDAETTTLDTWAELRAWAPTWAGLRQLGTFAEAAAPVVLAAAEVELASGYRFVRYSTG